MGSGGSGSGSGVPVAGRGDRSGPVAVLTGPPGAGKSSVGAELSRILGVAFRDTDTDIEATAGKPVSDIFVQDGEPAFRKMEREAVAAALREHRGVLSLGAGAVLDEGTQELLAAHTVVYLETGFETAARRVGMDRPRPMLIGNPRARLRQLFEERLPVYQRLATVAVQTDDYDPAEIAEDIAARLAGPLPSSAGTPGAARRPGDVAQPDACGQEGTGGQPDVAGEPGGAGEPDGTNDPG